MLNRYFSVTIPSDCFRKDIRYLMSVSCIRLGNHESKTFFYILIGRRKHEDLFFFGLHLRFGRKLDVGRRESEVEMI